MSGHFALHEEVGVNVPEDLPLPHPTVVLGVQFAVHPDEVVRSVVELVAVKMMADVTGLGQTPESRTDKGVNGIALPSDEY